MTNNTNITTIIRLVIAIAKMFVVAVNINDEIFDLCYKGVISLRFSPEDQQLIPLGETGRWEFATGNGTFALGWDKKNFDFECSNYTNDLGGALVITIPATPALTASFHQAVQKYNKAVQSYLNNCKQQLQ